MYRPSSLSPQQRSTPRPADSTDAFDALPIACCVDCASHRGQRSIFTLIANSGSLHKFDNSCTARIFSLHDFQMVLNTKDYGLRSEAL